MGDWLKLHRCLLNKPIWTNSTDEQKVILITILLMTNWQEKPWDYFGKKIMLQPGQFVTSLSKIQSACQSKKITTKKIRNALERFQKLEFLSDKPTGKSTKSGRVITIENWDIYQGSEDKEGKENGKQEGRQRADKGQTEGKHINKELKEPKEIKNKDNIPKNRIEEYTENEKLRNTLNEFLAMRKKIKSEMTDYALKLMLEKLDGLSGGSDILKVKILNQSIESSWKGIFALKEVGNDGKHNVATNTSEIPDKYKNFYQ